MSNNDFVLEAQPRQDVGKGASRRLRRQSGEIPAIIYGADKEPAAITLKQRDIYHAIQNEAFFSHILTINIGKQSENVIIKDLQRHPYKPFILHADFLRVKEDEEITVNVPLHFINEDTCVGVKQEGGVINHLLNELQISCLPRHLPEYIEVDIEDLSIGDSLHISHLKLPEGVTSIDLSHGEEFDYGVVSIVHARTEEELEALEEAPEEAAAPEEAEGEAGEEAAGEEGGEEEGGSAGEGGDQEEDKGE